MTTSNATPLHSPLHAAHAALGAKFGPFGDWEMPLEYAGGGVVAEHTAVREAVGVFDVSHLGKALIAGPGAAEFANTQFTNDLRRIGPGKAQYTMLCTEDGGVVDDLICYVVSDDEVFIVPNAANNAEIVARLSAAAPDGITITNQHTDFGVIAVQGPRSTEVLTALGLPTELDYMAFADARWDGKSVRVCRTGYTGEHGYELVPRSEDALLLWDALLAASGPYEGRAAGLGARDTLRTEMGYPLHGHELSLSISPVQAGATWAVGWKKDAFTGRDALVAERAEGPKRRLRGLRAIDRGIPRPGMPVLDADGTRVGETTSGTFSPTLKAGIALALIDSALGVEPGGELVVDVRGRPLRCEVVKPPFVELHTR